MKRLSLILLGLFLYVPVYAQVVPIPETPSVLPDGKLAPLGVKWDINKAKERRTAHLLKHGDHSATRSKVTASKYDLRDLGCVPPVKDQANCGSCYDFAGVGAVEIALMQKGIIPVDGGGLSEQYFMDCQNVGGCGGGLSSEVMEIISRTGCPLTKLYGEYQANSQTCKKVDSARFLKCDGLVYATPGSDRAKVQDIKNLIPLYGPVSIAIDGGNLGNGTNTTYVTGGGINHAVIIVGWDDTVGNAGSFIVRNSWSKDWGKGGYFYLSYNSVIVDAIAAKVTAPTPPPGPTPPDPTPPGPGPIPAEAYLKFPITPDVVTQYEAATGRKITPETRVKDLIEWSKPLNPEPPVDPISDIRRRLDAAEARDQEFRKVLIAIMDRLDKK